MKSKRYSFAATLVAVMMVAVVFAPVIGCGDSEAATDYWTYTVTSDGKVTSSGNEVQGFKAPVESGTYTKDTDGYDAGAWGFDSAGYGPFGSFYAAFDACHGNKMICHLNPNDLKSSVDGKISVDTADSASPYHGHTVNIMWILPTVYWSVDDDGNLILSNDPSKGTAYAHTITTTVDGKETESTYKYLAIGVYEASSATVDGKNILTSTSGTKPLHSQQRSVFRTYANNNVVATADGTTSNGQAMLWNLYAWQLYRFSVLTVGGGWNSQGIFGNGDVYGGHYGTSVNATGDLDKAGPYAGNIGDSGATGTATHHSDSVKAFIEDAWGSLYDFVDGVLIYYKDSQVQMYATQSSVPTNSSGDYTTMIGVLPSSSGYGSTATSSSTDPGFWGLPTGTSGSATSDLYDYIYSGTGSSSSSPYGLFVGGCSRGDGSSSPKFGLSCMSANLGVAYSNTSMGGRLAFVFDADSASTITYDHSALKALGVSDADIQKLPSGKEIEDENTTYDELTLDGYYIDHVGWTVGSETKAPGDTVATTSSHTAKSIWKVQTITMTFKIGDETDKTQVVNKGTSGTVYNPTVEGAFMGWFYDEKFTSKYDSSRTLTADTVLYGKVVPPLIFTSAPMTLATITNVNTDGLVYFDCTDSEGRASVLWDFGDGNTSTDAIAYNSYAESGKYTVTLTVTNASGQSAVATYDVEVGETDSDSDNGFPWKTVVLIGAVAFVAFVVLRRII